jgi:prepilin-type N-terminal cleavage/methylation domain-containing protein
MKSISKKKAFTLLEMIITLFIIGLMTTVVVINQRGADRGFALERSAYRLAQDIRQIQERSMSVIEPEGVEIGEDFIGSYGVTINSDGDSFFFVDLDDTKMCSSTTADCFYKMVELEDKIEIDEVILNESDTLVYIAFTPPDPAVSINDSVDEYTEVDIILQVEDDASFGKKKISINKVGLITVDDYDE